MNRNRSFRLLAIPLLILLICQGLLVAPARAQEKGSEEEQQIRAINRVKPCVVKIETVNQDGGTGTGSGVIIKEDGFIVTNYHVVKEANRIVVRMQEGKDEGDEKSYKKYHAVVAGMSPRNDLAVVKINATGLKVPPWGDSKDLKIGQVAIAIGNPYKFEGSVSRGIISALNRRIAAGGIIYKELIQTDAAINPGNSGGALIDSRGEVIGINTLVFSGKSGMPAQRLGFAIPIHRALDIARQLMSHTRPTSNQPWIGINGIDVTREMAEMNMLPVNQGVLITDVQAVSPAERGGVMKGDIVCEADGDLIKNVLDFKKILAKKKVGDTIELKIWREEKRFTLKIKVSQRSMSP